MNEPVQCPECKAYSGLHFLECSLQPKEYAIAQAKQYHSAWLTHQKDLSSKLNTWRNQVTMWQGKFAIVKHENNQLRKKNAKLLREQQESRVTETQGQTTEDKTSS